jgi:hypothetical protein
MSAIGGLFDGEPEDAATVIDVLSHPATTEISVATPEGIQELTLGDEDEIGSGPWVISTLAGPAEPQNGPLVDDEHAYALAADAETPAQADTVDEALAELREDFRTELADGGHLAKTVQSLASDVELPALAAVKAEGAVLVRNPTGVRPLYYGRDEEKAAFASERKPLWRIGLEARRVKPNTMVLIHGSGSQSIHLSDPELGPEPPADERLDCLAGALQDAVDARVGEADRVGILATRARPSALLGHHVREAGAEPVAFVPDPADGTRAEQIQDALATVDATVHRVPIRPEALVGRMAELLHAIEERDQKLAADAIVPFLASARAAGENVHVVFADRSRGDPFAPGALEAAHARAGPSEDESSLFAVGPLERAHKLARRSGVTLQVPLAAPRVQHLSEILDAETDGSVVDALLAHHGLDVARTPDVETERDQRVDVLREAVLAIDVPETPTAYDAVASLRQREHSGPGPGRAIVEPEDARGLDDHLQWGLDHRAIDAGAIGPDETQRLERYLENVEAKADR